MKAIRATALFVIWLAAAACSVQQSPAGTSAGERLATDSAAAATDVGVDSGNAAGNADTAAVGGVDAGNTNDPGAAGQPCSANGTCTSGICYRGGCVSACLDVGDCGANQDCSSDVPGRLFCLDRAYSADVGKSCAATGSCPGGLKCTGAKEAASAVCTGPCTDDTDCPMNMDCSLSVQGQTYCAARTFCSSCQHAGNCAEGGACVKMGEGSYCTRGCNAGSTECARYSSCNDIGGGSFQCVHKSGSCVGAGGQCSSCTGVDQCGGSCLTYPFSKESFCADDCTSSCPSGFKCVQVSQTGKGCVPDTKAPSLPTCVNKLGTTMNVGDIIDDFAMVGVTDTDGDGDLTKEDLRLFKFSHFAEHHKIIYFNVVAGWCGYCQAETKEFPSLDAQMYPKGVVIFQTLYDGFNPKQWTVPNEQVLRSWVTALKPQGVIGVDPERNCVPYNTNGSTPLNMIIDAKTREILDKWNGANMSNTKSRLLKALIGK